MCVLQVFLVLTSALLVFGANTCQQLKGMDKLDLNSYAQGTWYELARYDNNLEKYGNCVTTNYTKRAENDFVIEISEVEGNTLVVYDGLINIRPNDYQNGIVNYVFSDGDGSFEWNMTFLATDYKSYVIKYVCLYDQAKDTRTELAWILSRFKELTPEAKAAVSQFTSSSKLLDEKKFYWDAFSDSACKYDSTKVDRRLPKRFN